MPRGSTEIQPINWEDVRTILDAFNAQAKTYRLDHSLVALLVSINPDHKLSDVFSEKDLPFLDSLRALSKISQSLSESDRRLLHNYLCFEYFCVRFLGKKTNAQKISFLVSVSAEMDAARYVMSFFVNESYAYLYPFIVKYKETSARIIKQGSILSDLVVFLEKVAPQETLDLAVVVKDCLDFISWDRFHKDLGIIFSIEFKSALGKPEFRQLLSEPKFKEALYALSTDYADLEKFDKQQLEKLFSFRQPVDTVGKKRVSMFSMPQALIGLAYAGLFKLNHAFYLTQERADALAELAPRILKLHEKNNFTFDLNRLLDYFENLPRLLDTLENLSENSPQPWFLESQFFDDAYSFLASPHFAEFSVFVESNLDAVTHFCAQSTVRNPLLGLFNRRKRIELLLPHPPKLKPRNDYERLCLAFWESEKPQKWLDKFSINVDKDWFFKVPSLLLDLTKKHVLIEVIEDLPDYLLLKLYAYQLHINALMQILDSNNIRMPDQLNPDQDIQRWATILKGRDCDYELSQRLDQQYRNLQRLENELLTDKARRELHDCRAPLPKSHFTLWTSLATTSALMAAAAPVMIAWVLPSFVLSSEAMTALPTGLLMGLAVVVCALCVVGTVTTAKLANDHRTWRFLRPTHVFVEENQPDLVVK